MAAAHPAAPAAAAAVLLLTSKSYSYGCGGYIRIYIDMVKSGAYVRRSVYVCVCMFCLSAFSLSQS